jgi:alkaline phosphatase
MHSAHRQLWVRVIREANELEEDFQESLDWAETAMTRAAELALEGDVDGAAR